MVKLFWTLDIIISSITRIGDAIGSKVKRLLKLPPTTEDVNEEAFLEALKQAGIITNQLATFNTGGKIGVFSCFLILTAL